MVVTFHRWMCEHGVKSADNDVMKLALVMQVDEEFPNITNASEGKAYLQTFMHDEATRLVLEAALEKAWDEYATDNGDGTG
jgi:hypothetical protein